MRLEGKRAVVTGAGAGFGRAIAERFAHEGARVALLDISEAAATATAAALGPDSLALRADVSDDASVGAAIASVVGHWGGIDTVVNNAGIAQKAAPAIDTPAEQIDRIMAVNVRGIFHTTRHALAHLQQSRGTIVNIASNAGLRPRPGAAWYNASKAAVINLTYSLAAEYASSGVRVNAIAPALAATQMMTEILGEDEGGQLEQAIRATIPLGRLTEGSDVAAAATYLVSDEAVFVTGVVLPVDGGRMLA
ncbi:MAG: glucose 1-dehydrogenase [Solirubrobacteraceae bacterium]|nr:MAG: short chain dehydrogenase [Solirubrobacterales bacterium]